MAIDSRHCCRAIRANIMKNLLIQSLAASTLLLASANHVNSTRNQTGSVKRAPEKASIDSLFLDLTAFVRISSQKQTVFF